MAGAFGSACTESEDPDTTTSGATYPVGLLAPTSGTDAALGKDAVQGATLAVEVVNNVYADLPLPLASGSGIRGGGQLRLVAGDTESSADRVEAKVEELVKNGALGVVIVDNSAVAEAASRRTDPLGVALLDAHSTAESLTDLNRAGHFRLAPSDRQILQTVFELLRFQQAQRLPARRISVILGTTDSNLVQRLNTTIQDIGGAAGFNFVSTQVLTANGDVTRIAEKVTTDKPEVVLAGAMDARLAGSMTDLAGRLRGIAPIVTFGHGGNDLDLTKTNVLDVLRSSAWSAEYARRQPVAGAIALMYEKRFEAKMTEIAAEAFTATLAMAVAIDGAASPARDGVRASVQRLSLPATQTIMPWNGIRFDGNGTNELAVGVVEQRENAGFQVVYPRELSASAIVWK